MIYKFDKCQLVNTHSNNLSIIIPGDYINYIQNINYDKTYNIIIKTWYQKRSTGWKSQNHHLRGHNNQIAESLGYSAGEMWLIMKQDNPDWTMKEIILGNKIICIPESEANIDSLVASKAIDYFHRLADEMNIKLIEE